ncbi:MAG: glycosyltransferase [Verrucomicrobiales bacterium]|nr:glycosyltransferase [Verrucomicrobiales bacterium]
MKRDPSIRSVPVAASAADPRLLLLIPAYNEEGRIGPVLREYLAYFRAHYRGPFRLVVVLNGCRDHTLDLVEATARELGGIEWLDFPKPIGKGGALIEGLRLAPETDLIGYVDADGATPPAAFHDLVRQMPGYHCVIGSRWLPESKLDEVQPWKRRFASRAFHLWVESLFWMGIQDTQCGAKVMRREAVERIYPDLRTADLAFDINLLYCLKRAGFKVLEHPTEWADKIGSKIRLGRSSATMFLSTLRLRLVYSPFYKWLAPLRPIEEWLYLKLGAPPSRPPAAARRTAPPPTATAH